MTRLSMNLAGRLAMVILCFLATAGFARREALGQTFLDKIDIEPLRYISVQDNQTLKTYDTFARQQLTMITGKSSWEGLPATVVILDMAIRPADWASRNVIKVKNAPLRQDFGDMKGIDRAEKERIVKEGTVSLAFLQREDVGTFLEDLRSSANYKNQAVGELLQAGFVLRQLSSMGPQIPTMIIAPRLPDDKTWKLTSSVAANIPRLAETMKSHGASVPAAQAGYEPVVDTLDRIVAAQEQLFTAWKSTDIASVNTALRTLASELPNVNLAVYPSMAKRKVEVIYNAAAKLTIPGAFVYFIAFTLFLLAVYSGVAGLRKWALACFLLAFTIHTVAIGVRWWLVSKSVGNWFESIPIKNQFESVMFSAWFGALVGLVLEFWKGKGIWGVASCFVGWLSLVAIFSAPFVAGKDIGGEIGMVQGVLMSYWLYIHVTMVTASYALIGMSFLMGGWWLLKYYFGDAESGLSLSEFFAEDANSAGATLHPKRKSPLEALSPTPALAGGGDVSRTTGSRHHSKGGSTGGNASAAAPRAAAAALTKGPSLPVLDACNLVILQLAFWVLGVGIILGAVWADQSWGRPWGWDPKETFALVTWIIYLVVVHVRLATEHKAWWTAVLSIVGFIVMLFNWIGVNFFLVGLHSYA